MRVMFSNILVAQNMKMFSGNGIASSKQTAYCGLYYEKGLEDGLSGLIGLISGGQRDEYDFHKMIFDEPFLTAALLRAGFKSTRRWDWRKTNHVDFDDYSQAYIPHMDKENGRLMSLNLEAIK